MSATSYYPGASSPPESTLKQGSCQWSSFSPPVLPCSFFPSPTASDVSSLSRRSIDITGLPFSAGAKEVYDLVRPYGDLESLPAKVVNCCAKVVFRTEESATKAASALNGAVLYNFRLSVNRIESNRPDKEAVWAGFLCKGKNKDLVDVFPVKGDVELPLKGVAFLRLTHRARLEELNTFTPCALALMQQDSTAVTSLVGYLRRKQRAGYIPLRGFRLYLLPEGPETRKYGVRLSEQQLLCVFVKNVAQ